MWFSICRSLREKVYPRAIESFDGSGKGSVGTVHDDEELSWIESMCMQISMNDISLESVEVDATQHEISGFDFVDICTAMRANHTVTRLRIRNVDLQKMVSTPFQKVLQNTSCLSELYLEDTRGCGVISIGRALTFNWSSSINTLQIEGHVIDKMTSETLSLMLSVNKTLKHLRLRHNQIADEHVAGLARGIMSNHGIEELDLAGNGLNDASIAMVCKALQSHRTVASLCLNFNRFGMMGVQSVSRMLCSNQRIQEIQLFGNSIDSSGAESLATALIHNKHLETIILSFNRIGDVGASAILRALTMNVTLKKLWMPSNSIGNEALLTLGECLPRMRGIEHLFLGDYFDNAGAKAVASQLDENKSVTTLHMESPGYDDVEVQRVVDFHLRLNRLGGKKTTHHNHRGGLPMSLWPWVLEKAAQRPSLIGTPDVLYYMLRENPGIFSRRY